MTKSRALLLLAAIAAFVFAVPAEASPVTFVLNFDACTGTCGAAPFGTVTLTQSDLGGVNSFVTVLLTLKDGEHFTNTGAGEALMFNIGEPVTIGSLTSGFSAGSSDKASAVGNFAWSIHCDVCKGGKVTNPAGPLSFTVSSGTGVTIPDFVANGGGYYFASDIRGTNGNTGNVAAGGPAETPEPAAAWLLGAGLVMLAGVRRYRRS